MLATSQISASSFGRLVDSDGLKTKNSARVGICCIGFMLAIFCEWMPAVCGETQDKTVEQLVERVRQSHARCLQVPGGWATSFKLEVQQDPDTGDFAYSELSGVFRIKWPKLYCKINGITIEDEAAIEREAVYDFVTKASLARHNRSLVQATPYRHVWTAKHAFPLLFQYYAEASQYYFPGEELKDLSDHSDLWLPQALEKFAYQVGGQEVVEGIPCQIVTRPGVDTMWFAPDHSYVLCRREIHYGPGKPLRERVLNTNLQEIAPGVWIPTRQVLTQFTTMDQNPDAWNQLRVKLTLTLADIEAGHVPDSDFDVEIPDGAEIDDQIRDMVYTKLRKGQDPMEEALRRGRELMNQRREMVEEVGWGGVLLWVNLAILLALGLFFVARRVFVIKP